MIAQMRAAEAKNKIYKHLQQNSKDNVEESKIGIKFNSENGFE